MKHTLKSVRALAATLITFASLAGGANAALLITFEEVGGDVIATTSGSLVVPASPDVNFSGNFLVGGDNSLSYLTGNFNLYYGGTFGGMSISLTPSSGSGSTFGIEASAIYLDSTAAVGSSYTPATTWTWSGQTLSSIGLSSLTSSPTTVYTAKNGSTVSIASIPEPSSTLLLGFGAGSFLVLRRRRK